MGARSERVAERLESARRQRARVEALFPQGIDSRDSPEESRSDAEARFAIGASNALDWDAIQQLARRECPVTWHEIARSGVPEYLRGPDNTSVDDQRFDPTSRPYNLFDNPLLYPSYRRAEFEGRGQEWHGPTRSVIVGDAKPLLTNLEHVRRATDTGAQAWIVFDEAQGIDTEAAYNIAIEALVFALHEARKHTSDVDGFDAGIMTDGYRAEVLEHLKEYITLLRGLRDELRSRHRVARNGVDLERIEDFVRLREGAWDPHDTSEFLDALRTAFLDQADHYSVKRYLDWADLGHHLSEARDSGEPDF